MQIVVYALSGLLALLGLVFIVGAQGQTMRLVIGLVLFAGAAGLIALQRLRPSHTTVTQKLDVTGDIQVQHLQCRTCGGPLTNENLAVKAGAVFVDCPFCGATYQLEEDIKW